MIRATDGKAPARGDRLVVVPADRAPTLATPTPRTVREGDTLRVVFAGRRPGGRRAALLLGLPARRRHARPVAGVFEWTPSYVQRGSTRSRSPSPTAFADAHYVSVTSRTPTAQPILEGLESWTVARGSRRLHRRRLDPATPSFVPPPGTATARSSSTRVRTGSLTTTLTGSAAGRDFDPGTSTFSWTPDFDAAGAYTMRLEVEDGRRPRGRPGDRPSRHRGRGRRRQPPAVLPDLPNRTTKCRRDAADPARRVDPRGPLRSPPSPRGRRARTRSRSRRPPAARRLDALRPIRRDRRRAGARDHAGALERGD